MADRIVTVGVDKTYSTPALAIAGEANFQTGEDNIVFTIDAGTYGRFEILSSSVFTPSATHRLRFICASGVSHTVRRGYGVRIINTNEWYPAIYSQLSYVEINGIAMSSNITNGACGIETSSDSQNCLFINCLAYECNDKAYSTPYGSSGHRFINCLAYNCNNGFYIGGSSVTSYYYNCVALNSAEYGFFNSAWSDQHLINCYAGGSGTADFLQNENGGGVLTTCRSSDGSRSTTILAVTDCYFTNDDAGTEDVHIASNSGLIDIGTDLSADAVYPFNYDAIDVVRTGSWDIGAIEYVASGGDVSGTLTLAQKKQTVTITGTSEAQLDVIGSLAIAQKKQSTSIVGTSEIISNDRIVTVGTGRDYSTLVLALAGQADVQIGEENLVFIVDAGVYSPPDITSCAWTPTALHRLIVQCAEGDFHGFVRGQGVIITTTVSYALFSVEKNYTTFDGIAITCTADEGITSALEFWCSYVEILNCFVYDVLIGSGITFRDNAVIQYNKFINCVAFNCRDTGLGIHTNTDGATDLLLDNCVVLNCGVGIQASGYTTTYVKNCYCGNNTLNYRLGSDGSYPTFTSSYSNDEALGSGLLSVASCNFPNITAGTENIIFTAGSSLIGIGADLRTDAIYNLTVDAFGTLRPATPCIGPYEYVAIIIAFISKIMWVM